MMGRMWNAYRAELTKAFRRKFSFAGPVLVVLVVLSTLAVRPVTRDGSGDYTFIAYATPLALNLVGLLFLLTYCAALVSSELAAGTVCLVLTRPLRRHEFVAAKLMLGMTMAVLLTGVAAGAAWVATLALGDLIGVSYGAEVLYTNVEMLQAYALGAALCLLPQFAAVAFAVMVSSLTRSTGAAIGCTVAFWVLIDAVKYPLRFAPYVFSTYLETPWQVFADRCIGLDSAWLPDALYVAATSAGFFILFAGVSILALRRRDLRT